MARKNYCYDADPDFLSLTLPINYSPDQRLLAAVLYRAILDCITRATVTTHDRCSAKRYIFGPEQDGPLSFEFVCEELDMNPDEMREAIRELEKNPPEITYRRRQDGL